VIRVKAVAGDASKIPEIVGADHGVARDSISPCVPCCKTNVVTDPKRTKEPVGMEGQHASLRMIVKRLGTREHRN
jgi:hypothetical protein